MNDNKHKLTACVIGQQVERLGPGDQYAPCNRLDDGQVVEVHEVSDTWARVSPWHWPDLYDYDQQDNAHHVQGKVARWLPMDCLAIVHEPCSQDGGLDG